MSRNPEPFVGRLFQLAPLLSKTGGYLSGEAAAHGHLVATTRSTPEGALRYPALPPRSFEAIPSPGAELPEGVAPDQGAVAAVVGQRLDLFGTRVVLPGEIDLPLLTREAVMAQLLEKGGLALGLAGLLLRLVDDPPLDVDEIRELLKAARRGERFQPLLELLGVLGG